MIKYGCYWFIIDYDKTLSGNNDGRCIIIIINNRTKGVKASR